MSDIQQPRDRAWDEAAIHDLEASYDAAWGQGDVEALVACLAEDAVVMNPRGQLARGRAEIAMMLRAFLRGPANGSQHTSEIYRVEFITEDVAIVDGHAVLEGVRPADGATRSTISHYFSDVVVKRQEGWVIAHVRAYHLMSEEVT